jgi:hypothetical protein
LSGVNRSDGGSKTKRSYGQTVSASPFLLSAFFRRRQKRRRRADDNERPQTSGDQ